MKYRECNRCNQIQPINKFIKRKLLKDGFSNQCNKCINKRVMARVIENKKEIHKIDIFSYKNCTTCKKLKQLIEFNKDQRSRDGHSFKCKLCQRKYDNQYYKKYNSKHKKRKNEYIKLKRKTNLSFKIQRRISAVFNIQLKNKNTIKMKKFFQYTGIKIDNYINHLKKDKLWELFKLNNLEIHIDHIIPLSIYDFENENDIKKAWNPKNLRFSFKNENLSKSNKIDIKLIKKYKIKHLLPENFKMENL